MWNQCSHFFATNASGAITVLLQPQNLYYDHGPVIAFRNTSIFSMIELPSMNTSSITSITILLLANKTLAPDEICGHGSLVDLRNAIYTKFHFEPSCVDDPEKIIGILCQDGQEHTPECMAAYMTAHNTPPDDGISRRELLVWAIIGTSASGVMLLAVIVLAYNVIKMRAQPQYIPVRNG